MSNLDLHTRYSMATVRMCLRQDYSQVKIYKDNRQMNKLNFEKTIQLKNKKTACYAITPVADYCLVLLSS